ncbi:MAG: hypothetical protein FIB00_10790 [Chloroflexi bacterium]|nr:hypothetical protein [Chloroflexota bacterium]PWB45717.1 MAG: hypothetical protein C3F10_05325 [Dehalococcoidia bacterium]
MNDHGPPASLGGQLSLFEDEGVLPAPDWRGKSGPEMRAETPAGYRLDLSGEEPVYVLDADRTPLPTEDGDELFDEDTAVAVGDNDRPDEDDDAVNDERWSAPREWAPYCADTIAMKGTIRKPASRLGALWICTGGSGRAIDRDKRGMSVYRVVPLDTYRGPHPGLPLTYREHTALPNDHPFRWGYEGMLVTWQKKPHVLTDEHLVFSHPYIPNPDGYGYVPDPDWHPHDEDAVRSERNPWRDHPQAWQPTRRLI